MKLFYHNGENMSISFLEREGIMSDMAICNTLLKNANIFDINFAKNIDKSKKM